MQPNIERRNISLLILAVTAIYSFLIVLFKNYYSLSFTRFVSICKIAFTDFFVSKEHFFGLIVLSLILMGSTLFSLKVLFTYLKTHNRIRSLLKLRTDRYHSKVVNISNLTPSQINIVETSERFAFNYGLLKSKIAISTGLIESLSDQELEAVVLHETYHLQNSHVILFLLAELSNALLFFIPVINTLVRNIKLGFEINADSATASAQGTSKHLRYALAKTLSPVPYLSTPPNFSVSMLEQRVSKLLNKNISVSFKRFEIFASVFTVSLLLSLFLFSSTGHAQTNYEGITDEAS